MAIKTGVFICLPRAVAPVIKMKALTGLAFSVKPMEDPTNGQWNRVRIIDLWSISLFKEINESIYGDGCHTV